VLRTVAELIYGVQTSATVTKAIGWLADRRHWSTKRLMDYFRDLVDPLIGMEKSPVTSLKLLWIERAYAFYPKAYFLHLTRHPVSTRKSMDEFFENRRSNIDGQNTLQTIDSLLDWYRFHKNIMEFTKTLPVGQTMRVKGEDVLSDPDIYLPQIAEWLGIRTDKEAIEAMKHPEMSPYAYRGPEPARGGNDPKFMRSPALRRGRLREPSLKEFFVREKLDWLSDRDKQICREAGYILAPAEELVDEITGLSLSLGYR
ncbi:MAG: sulfotransferase, partial [Pseudomonadota bacterium]|nr:sulfotransferase [Pseudomonadota bacterium]